MSRGWYIFGQGEQLLAHPERPQPVSLVLAPVIGVVGPPPLLVGDFENVLLEGNGRFFSDICHEWGTIRIRATVLLLFLQ